MQTLAIAQAKNNFSAMLHFVEAGEDVVLTRHGKAIARIVSEAVARPSDEMSVSALRREAMLVLNSFRAKVAPGAPLDWKALRDAGKKY
jgi:prevent-host-death family protein